MGEEIVETITSELSVEATTDKVRQAGRPSSGNCEGTGCGGSAGTNALAVNARRTQRVCTGWIGRAILRRLCGRRAATCPPFSRLLPEGIAHGVASLRSRAYEIIVDNLRLLFARGSLSL